MIGVDMSFVTDDEVREGRLFTSFSIFTAELLDGFAALGLQRSFCLMVYPWQEKLVRSRFPGFSVCVVSWKPSQWLDWLTKGRIRCRTLIRRLNRHAAAVKKHGIRCVWFPYAIPERFFAPGVPYVSTVHDLMVYHNTPELRQAFADMIGASAAVAAISDHTRRDILREFSYPAERIRLIPNSICVNMAVQEKPQGIRGGYILDINGYGPHKNAITLIKAYEKLLDRTGLDLVLCGGWDMPPCLEQLKEYVRAHGFADRVHFYLAVPEAQRNWLLCNAALFVTPSTNEGFGRTPVEAAICGVSVISTTAASLREATKGLVHYYEDPQDHEALAECMLRCITEPDSPETLAAISHQLAQSYAPERCAAAYWEIFRQFALGHL